MQEIRLSDAFHTSLVCSAFRVPTMVTITASDEPKTHQPRRLLLQPRKRGQDGKLPSPRSQYSTSRPNIRTSHHEHACGWRVSPPDDGRNRQFWLQKSVAVGV